MPGDINPAEAFLTSLGQLPPEAPTACEGWTAHELAAHLAAGIDEIVEFIEDAVDRRPARATRGFEEREAPYRAMPDAEVRQRLGELLGRAARALEAQRDASLRVEFFGRSWTADEFLAHTGTEFALHRWDLVGDDDQGEAFFSPPQVTAGAVSTLNMLEGLAEASANRGRRAGLADTRVILRSPGRSDVGLEVDGDGRSAFTTFSDDATPGGIIVSTDPVNRLLTLWGRRSQFRPVTVTGDPAIWPAVRVALWGDAPAWPGQRGPSEP